MTIKSFCQGNWGILIFCVIFYAYKFVYSINFIIQPSINQYKFVYSINFIIQPSINQYKFVYSINFIFQPSINQVSALSKLVLCPPIFGEKYMLTTNL